MAKYEPIQFTTNVPSDLILQFDNCYRNHHPEYGESYSYIVQCGGVDWRWRVKPFVHERLIEMGAGKGAHFRVTKKEIEGGKLIWDIALIQAPTREGIQVRGDSDTVSGVGQGDVPTPTEMVRNGVTTPQRERGAISPLTMDVQYRHFTEALSFAAKALEDIGVGDRSGDELDFLYKVAFTLYKDTPLPKPNDGNESISPPTPEPVQVAPPAGEIPPPSEPPPEDDGLPF